MADSHEGENALQRAFNNLRAPERSLASMVPDQFISRVVGTKNGGNVRNSESLDYEPMQNKIFYDRIKHAKDGKKKLYGCAAPRGPSLQRPLCSAQRCADGSMGDWPGRGPHCSAAVLDPPPPGPWACRRRPGTLADRRHACRVPTHARTHARRAAGTPARRWPSSRSRCSQASSPASSRSC
jgi:hypothetical protein